MQCLRSWISVIPLAILPRSFFFFFRTENSLKIWSSISKFELLASSSKHYPHGLCAKEISEKLFIKIIGFISSRVIEYWFKCFAVNKEFISDQTRISKSKEEKENRTNALLEVTCFI